MEKDTIDFERLADWMDGRLSEEDAATIVKQLESADDATRENLEWLRTFKRAGKAAAFTTPPVELHAELMRRFEAYTREHPKSGFFRRLVASLTFDSGAQLVTAGLRSVELPSSKRQLVYSSDAADVILNFQPRPHDTNIDLIGEILPGDDALNGPFSIQLLQDSAEIKLSAVDEINEFSFESIPPGAYKIILSSDQAEIQIPLEINL